jgi:hypothetical protein
VKKWYSITFAHTASARANPMTKTKVKSWRKLILPWVRPQNGHGGSERARITVNGAIQCSKEMAVVTSILTGGDKQEQWPQACQLRPKEDGKLRLARTSFGLPVQFPQHLRNHPIHSCLPSFASLVLHSKEAAL